MLKVEKEAALLSSLKLIQFKPISNLARLLQCLMIVKLGIGLEYH